MRLGDTHGLQDQQKFIQRICEVGAKDYEPRADASRVESFIQTGRKTQIYRLSFFTCVFFFGGNDVRGNKKKTKTRFLDKYCDLL